MNVYEKLQKCRVELQEMKIKKSGNNRFAGYKYFELGDFLKEINKLCLEHKLFTQTSFNAEIATLQIINIEKPEEIILFTSPMAEASLKGCHQIQNMGAVETYQRRYLLLVAFEIIEDDGLEATTGVNSGHKLSVAKLNNLYSVANKAGYDKPKVDVLINKKYNVQPNKLSEAQYNELVTGYEKLHKRDEE